VGHAAGPNFSKSKREVYDEKSSDTGRSSIVRIVVLDRHVDDGTTEPNNGKEDYHSKNVCSFRGRDV
jgi:hypothetical protein